MRHRPVSGLDSGIHFAALELQLRFEHLALRCRELEFGRRDDFACALAFAQIADTVLASIAPILIELGCDVVRRHDHQVFDHLLALGFADALDEGAERSRPALRSVDVAGGEAVDHFGMRFDGTAPMARPYEPALCSHSPPSMTWKCGTA